MSYVSKTINELFRDTQAREVVDLETLLDIMVSDYAKGIVDEDDLRTFLFRNKRFLQAAIDQYGKQRITVDELIDKLIDAVLMDAAMRPGKSISQLYYTQGRRKAGSEEKNKVEVL